MSKPGKPMVSKTLVPSNLRANDSKEEGQDNVLEYFIEVADNKILLQEEGLMD